MNSLHYLHVDPLWGSRLLLPRKLITDTTTADLDSSILGSQIIIPQATDIILMGRTILQNIVTC